jgi:hypothetical protein
LLVTGRVRLRLGLFVFAMLVVHANLLMNKP